MFHDDEMDDYKMLCRRRAESDGVRSGIAPPLSSRNAPPGFSMQPQLTGPRIT